MAWKPRYMRFLGSTYTRSPIPSNITFPNRMEFFRPMSTKVLSENLTEKPKTDPLEHQSTDPITYPAISASNLNAFLTDCAWNNKENDGFNALLIYRKQNGLTPADAQCCHLLMEAFAKRGDFEKSYQIYDAMRQDVIVTPQTYVYLLESLARMEWSDEILEVLQRSIKEAAENVSIQSTDE